MLEFNFIPTRTGGGDVFPRRHREDGLVCPIEGSLKKPGLKARVLDARKKTIRQVRNLKAVKECVIES